MGDQAGVTPDQVEESSRPRLLGELFGVGVRAFEDRQLLERQTELLEPRRRMGDGLLGTLPCRRGRDHESGSGSRGAGQKTVLLLVARVELVASHEGEHPGCFRHVRRIWRCLFE